MTATTDLRRAVTERAVPAVANSVAASTVACQVRKSFAVISPPLASRR